MRMEDTLGPRGWGAADSPRPPPPARAARTSGGGGAAVGARRGGVAAHPARVAFLPLGPRARVVLAVAAVAALLGALVARAANAPGSRPAAGGPLCHAPATAGDARRAADPGRPALGGTSGCEDGAGPGPAPGSRGPLRDAVAAEKRGSGRSLGWPSGGRENGGTVVAPLAGPEASLQLASASFGAGTDPAAPLPAAPVPVAIPVPLSLQQPAPPSPHAEPPPPREVNVKDFGARGDGITDDAPAFTRAAASAVARRVPLAVPGGIYRLASRPFLALNGLEIRGAGFQNTVLRCEYPGPGIVIDAFERGGATDPFIHVDVLDLTIEGNPATSSIFLAQGIHRSTWRIRAQEAHPEEGIAFDIRGCMSNTMHLQSSVDLAPMRSRPREGIRLSMGVRAGASVGNSTNNTIRAQIDGLGIGLRLVGADQSLFEGGYTQSNSIYGLVTAPTSRFNLFVATAFENPGSKADVADGGESNRYINCYSTNAFLLQGRMAEVVGGVHERIQVDRGAFRNRVHSLSVNHFQLGRGGLFDLGTGTDTRDVFGTTLTASFAANVMMVTDVAQGAVRVGQVVHAPDLEPGTTVTALGSGTGGPGTYVLSTSPGALSPRTVRTDGDISVAPVPVVSPDRGDTSATLRVSFDARVQRWATDLSADRTITLSTADARNGDSFRVVRTARGPFTLDVGGLKTIPAGKAAFVDVAFDGTAWVLTAYGEL